MSAGARTERLANEIREILSTLMVRGDIKDPRVADAGLITFTHVTVTGDLRQAKAHFIVFGADEAKLKAVQAGLSSASGWIRHEMGDKLRLRAIPTVEFVIDRVFAQEEKIERLLHEVANEKKPPPEGD